MNKISTLYFNELPMTISVADKPELNKKYPEPQYFKVREFKNFKNIIDTIISDQLPYSPVSFTTKRFDRYGYRSQENFGVAKYVCLDVDTPDISIKEVIANIKKHQYLAAVLPTQNHMKVKNGKEKCERFRVFIPLMEIVSSPLEYKLLCKKLSEEICNGFDDPKCHEGARFFYPTPKEHKDKVIYIEGDCFPDPVKLTDDELIECKKMELSKKKRTNYKKTSLVINDKNMSRYQKSINLSDSSYKISHFNESNGTFNLYRDENDKNPGAFMFKDDIKIFDNKGNKVENVNHTFDQITEATETKAMNLEVLRKETSDKVVDDLDITKEFNIIITSEGLGKSKLIPEYMEKFNAKRIVVVCKGYEQLYDKKALFKKNYPNLDVEIILGGERFLDKYDVHKDEWVWGQDENTGERYINLITTIRYSSIDDNAKGRAINEIDRYSDISSKEIPMDIILMVEDKLRMEAILKNNYCNDLIVWDEFNPSHWFQHRLATQYEQECGKFTPELYSQETWKGFHSTMISEQFNWFNKLKGKKIVLSTENKTIDYFNKHYNDVNIVDERNVFVAKNANIWSVHPGIVKRDNKEKLASAFRVNDFLMLGNGINSKINHVAMLGMNYHEILTEDNELVLVLNQPSPAELAPIMKNYGISDKEATILLMTDVLNQYFGRFNGYRDSVKFKSFDVLIPNNLINDILPNLRYVCPVHRNISGRFNKNKEPRLFEKILYTMTKELGYLKYQNSMLNLKSLYNKAINFVEEIKKEGTKLIGKLKGMKFYKFTEKQKDNGITNDDLNRYFYRYVKSYGIERAIKLLYSTFSERVLLKNMSNITVKYGQKVQFLA